MIAKGSAISHGATAISYNTEKENSRLIAVHGLKRAPEADDLWSQMVRHQMLTSGNKPKSKPVIKTALRFELSPENEYTEKWTIGDWKRLAEEFLREMDGFNPREQNPASQSRPTNLCNSQYVVSLHSDSRSGIRHLHILVNRIDNEGNTNDAHKIGFRAAHAANVISERHGWTTAQERREENIANITNACYDVLRSMTEFSWSEYKTRLREKGYTVQLRTDSTGLVRGYSIRKGNSVYKASELRGRGLLASRIVPTWQQLHHLADMELSQTARQTRSSTSIVPKIRRNTTTSIITGRHCQSVTVDGKTYKMNIPEKCMEEIREEFSNHPYDIDINDRTVIENATNVAMLLFCQYLDAATSISESCGGGGGVSGGWGKRDDEDDLAWMRRCARQAIWLCKPIMKNRRRR